ncbi:23S rRNA pseudouridine(2605) synthase RluB [Psychrosphaera ytuae]|uniref:Pseudouridine synthase n=1 Tax=Psychrosphaera ytuae TaxID=2820710 RepID=A0A975DBS2_9GAMM|nr:23S rRNA pseudouridine(2605) synthase RluB [Psychrosphaera ytuae]QTH64206.1 23S rRNA pseudouridine(2605) synthase RluB [Psychrosphaera ytuae]
MSEKLQKVLARSGVGSRREMETYIANNRVSVNGNVAKLGDRVDGSETIRVDGHIVDVRSREEEICRVLMYNKPEGEMCTRKDPEGRPTVYDRLPQLKNSRWIGIGRLDVNTSGLLLFTNDGELANRLMHPSYEIEREYSVRVFGEVTNETLQNITQGVELEDGLAKFDRVKAERNMSDEGKNKWYSVSLREGRNREVRRLWASQDVTVSRLVRVRYADIKLDRRLIQGGWKELGLDDVNALRKKVGLDRELREFNPNIQKETAQTRRVEHARIKRAVKKHKMRQTKKR